MVYGDKIDGAMWAYRDGRGVLRGTCGNFDTARTLARFYGGTVTLGNKSRVLEAWLHKRLV